MRKRNATIPPRTAEDSVRLEKLRAEVLEQLRDPDFSEPRDLTAAWIDDRDRGANELADRLRETSCRDATVLELATVCRVLLAWDVESFYGELGLDDGDDSGLARVAGEWIDIRPRDWDT